MSDEGSNFLGAKIEVKEVLNELYADQLVLYLAKKCDVCMIALCSSDVGAVWKK